MKLNLIHAFYKKHDDDTNAIFTISSNDIDVNESNSKDEDSTNPPRRWTQVRIKKFKWKRWFMFGTKNLKHTLSNRQLML